MARLSSFTINDKSLEVDYIETINVKDGVVCDTYSFKEDTERDLAVVRVDKGSKTPLQKVFEGTSTIEGFIGGEGALEVVRSDGKVETHNF